MLNMIWKPNVFKSKGFVEAGMKKNCIGLRTRVKMFAYFKRTPTDKEYIFCKKLI